jgi:hypothetical protein
MWTKRTAKSLFAGLVLCVFPYLCAHADDFDNWGRFDYERYPVIERPGLHAVERAGITVGGDVVTSLTNSNGTIREISAGGLYQIGLGMLYRYPTIPFSIEVTFNYQYDAAHNNGDSASFRRNPLEGVLYFDGLNPFRIGAGVRHVYAARAESTINGVSEKYNFQNAHGRIVEIGYEVQPYGWVYLRYVKESYLVENYIASGSTTPGLSRNVPYDGSHWGLFISYEY